jgi:hypothetical protein
MSGVRALLPREYGAYAELAFPLLLAFLAGGVSVAGVGFALAAVSWFLVREPLAVLAGVRGVRLETALAAPARRSAILLGALGTVAAAAAMIAAPPVARLSALVPGGAAALLAPALVRGRAKSLGSELLVATALSAVLVPVGISGHMTPRLAWGGAAVWAASFVLATLAVHAVKARAKPGRGTWTVRAAPALGLGVVAGALGGAAVGRLPAFFAFAALPSALLVLGVIALGTHPRHLRRVGWSLVAADGVTLALLLLA